MKIVSKIFLSSAFLSLVACSDAAKTEQEVQEPAQNIQNQSQPVQGQSQTPSNNNAGVILNPPHGEPGHDCAVQVGAPLPSQPQNTQQQSSPVQMNATPVNSSNNSNSQGSVVAINPPHGEPGHDCTIDVGAPLNSK